jgi:beta-fructofuranosidase
MSDAMVPAISGDWRLLFRPEKYGAYVNDHTLLQTRDGVWHLYGCTKLGAEVNPEMERYLCHGSTPSLETPMQEHRPVIDHGTRAWAPGAIAAGEGYYLFYGPSPTKMAHSIDGSHWMGNDVRLHGCPIDAAHRDHMVVQLDPTTWLLYAVGIRNGYGCVSVHRSHDLQDWHFAGYAFTTSGRAPLRPAWGAVESPFVVRHGERWYLFITYTDCRRENYQDTLVFSSDDPLQFGEYTGDNHDRLVIAQLRAHAAEILHDPVTGKWFATTCGWRGFGIPHEGGVSIAELTWG